MPWGGRERGRRDYWEEGKGRREEGRTIQRTKTSYRHLKKEEPSLAPCRHRSPSPRSISSTPNGPTMSPSPSPTSSSPPHTCARQSSPSMSLGSCARQVIY